MRTDIRIFNKSKYELLAPAGSFDALKAAISAGCDAVYVGGNMFGARAFANNFSTEELIQAIDYCHTYGKAIYLTVNTLLKNEEIDDLLFDYLKPLYEAGLDAVIVQDLGVLQYIKKHFPNIELHASTQMTVLGRNFAKELQAMGVKRVVTPRELSLNEINNIYKNTGVEIETFIHGALCYCYSGQCLMSSLIGQRSGNRGKCAQPCRLPYSLDKSKSNEYFLSPKDLCSIRILPDILEAGIYSLKIEGRMKSPEYVATVTSIYRKYIDMYEMYGRENYNVDESDINKLLDIYNRGGFTEGFFKQQNSKNIIYTKKPNHLGVKAGTIKKISGNNIYFDSIIDLNKNDVMEFKLKNGEYVSFNLGADSKSGSKCTGFLYKKNVKDIKELANTELYRMKNNSLTLELPEYKLGLNCSLSIKSEENIKVRISYGDIFIDLQFDKPSVALKQALTKDTIIKQMMKTGNEEFDFALVDIELDDDLFLPMGVLNQIRRDSLEAFKCTMLQHFKREIIVTKPNIHTDIHCDVTKKVIYSALVNTEEQLNEVLKFDSIKKIYIESSIGNYEKIITLCSKVSSYGKLVYLALPHITRKVFEVELDNNILFYKNNGFNGYLFRNLETFYMFKAKDICCKEAVFDSNIYTFNNYAYDFYINAGAKVLTASYEHNINELKSMNKDVLELNIYGYIPMMFSANCINKTTGMCKNNFNKDKPMHYISLVDRMRNELKTAVNCKYCYNIIYNNVPLSAFEELDTFIKADITNFRLNFTLEDNHETKRILEYYLNNNLTCAPLDYTKGHLKRGV